MVGGPNALWSFAAFAPAAGLAVAAGAAGIAAPVGIACAAGAVAWTAIDLLAIDPRLRRGAGSITDITTAFMRRALRAGTVDDVARDLTLTLTRALGARLGRAALIVPGAEGVVRAIALAGAPPQLGDPSAALEWLGLLDDSIDRAGIATWVDRPAEDGGGDGPRAALALCDATGADVVLPLRHRGMLLGVVTLARPPERAGDPELARLLRALRAYTTAAVARAFLAAEVVQKGKLSKSVDLATAMQEAMMPSEKPVRRPDFELRGLFRPVAECGGDLWMWRSIGEDKVLLLIADATGHGAAPALLAAVAKGTVDALCELAGTDVDPGQLLSQLGRVVYRAGKRRYMMTAFAAVVDLRTRTVKVANAGQNFPFVVRASGPEGTPVVEPIVVRGDTLGSAPRVRYDSQERTIAPGDRLFLYTDGVIDAGTPVKEPWGEKRLRRLLVAMARERGTKLPDLIWAELEQHTAGNPMGDDVTMLVFELLDAAAAGAG
ncbi:MAG: serine/threonine-protein phosphatase [Deltaproteobacteria bacterium]|nr:serine/threonine-protein phosphatase [Deltaproteobacteria bacterium]